MDGRPLRIIRVKCDQMLNTSFVCSDTKSLLLSPHIRGLRYVSSDRGHVSLQCHKDWALIGTVCYKVLNFRQITQKTAALLDARCTSVFNGRILRVPYVQNSIYNAMYVNHVAFLMDKLMDDGTGLGIYSTLADKKYAKSVNISDFVYGKQKQDDTDVYQLEPVDPSHNKLLKLMAKLSKQTYFQIYHNLSSCSWVWGISSLTHGYVFLVKEVECGFERDTTHIICERPTTRNIPRCNKSQFSCDDGSCILGIYSCDGVFDCYSGYDELNCTKSFHLRAESIHILNKNIWGLGNMMCSIYHDANTRNTKCLSSSRLCDNIYDVNFEKIFCEKNRLSFPKYRISNHSVLTRWKSNISQNVLFSKTIDFANVCILAPENMSDKMETDPSVCSLIECPLMFKCKSNYCIPIEAVCDGTFDCRDKTDEELCEKTSCPGLLKCRGEKRCLPDYLICDNKVDCLYSADDELYCQPCPVQCQCSGYSILCEQYPSMYEIYHKYVKFVFPIATAKDIPILKHAIFSDFSHCHLSDLNLTGHIPSTIMLNISHNSITQISWNTLDILKSLHTLDLSYNKITWLETGQLPSSLPLKILFLQNTNIKTINRGNFSNLLYLEFLHLGNNPIQYVYVRSLQILQHIRIVKGVTPLFCCMVHNTQAKCQDNTGNNLDCQYHNDRDTSIMCRVLSSIFIIICTLTFVYMCLYLNRDRNIVFLSGNRIICAILQFVYLIFIDMFSALSYIIQGDVIYIYPYDISAKVLSALAMELGICFGITRDSIICLKTLYPFKHQCRYLKYAPFLFLVMWCLGLLKLFLMGSKKLSNIVAIDRLRTWWFFSHFSAHNFILLLILHVVSVLIMMITSTILLRLTNKFQHARGGKRKFNRLKWDLYGNCLFQTTFSIVALLSFCFAIYIFNISRATHVLAYMFIYVSGLRDLIAVFWQVLLDARQRCLK